MSINKAALALCSLTLACGIALAAVDTQSGTIENTSAQRISPAGNVSHDSPTSIASLR